MQINIISFSQGWSHVLKINILSTLMFTHQGATVANDSSSLVNYNLGLSITTKNTYISKHINYSMLYLVNCQVHAIFHEGSLDIDFTQPDHGLRMSDTGIFHPLGMSMIHQVCMNNFRI